MLWLILTLVLLMIIQYQQNEYYELQDNMAEVWADAAKVHEVNKELKRRRK